jgi:hypothetical protein
MLGGVGAGGEIPPATRFIKNLARAKSELDSFLITIFY